MAEESLPVSPISSSSYSSSSSSLLSTSQAQEEQQDGDSHNENQEQHQQQQQQQQRGIDRNLSFIRTVPTPIVDSSDDAWSCIVVLLTVWFIASLTVIVGFYGPSDLQVGPNCSRLLHVNSMLVSEIKVEELNGPKDGIVLYGFHKSPRLDAETTWSETHETFVSYSSHKEWVYFLNEGSELNITYSAKSHSSPLSLVIAQGKHSLIEWIQDPLYANLTLSWNVIYGSGTIQQRITRSSYYYVAVANLNQEDMKVKLNFSIRAILYNTSEAYCRCSLTQGDCSFKLFFLESNAAVLTSSGPEKGRRSDNWFAKLSYEPRWISYFGAMTILILMILKLCNNLTSTAQPGVSYQAGEGVLDRTPFLGQKENDTTSLGSSYESVSHDEQDGEDLLTTGSLDNNHPHGLCVICFDAPRDCFFLPCGHCATCFSCGTRIVQESGACPICRRKMKKVRKIYTA